MRISNWPLVTVSPSLAWISTTRPEASEITGTLRETSALTTPVTLQLGRPLAQFRGGQRELLRVIHRNHVHIGFVFHLRRRRRFGLRIRLALGTAPGHPQCQRQRQNH